MSAEWTNDMRTCIGALVQGLRMRRAAVLRGDVEEFTAVDNAIGMTIASLDQAIGEWLSTPEPEASKTPETIAKCDECGGTDPNSPGYIIVEHYASGGKYGYYRGSAPCGSRFHIRNQLVICDCESASMIHDVGCPNRDILKQ